MHGDTSYWKLACFLGLFATVSTGFFAAVPADEPPASAQVSGSAVTGPDYPGGRVNGSSSTNEPSQNDGPTASGRDAKVQNLIRQALQTPAEAKQTGDPVLDGILEVIQDRGSLVASRIPESPTLEANRGFNQPPQAQPPQAQFPQHQPSQHQPPHSQRPNYPDLAGLMQQRPQSFGQPPVQYGQPDDYGRPIPHESFDSPQQEQQFLLAEQLLMTARLLSNDLEQQHRGQQHRGQQHRGQGGYRDQGHRQQLIRMLREEAARCLNMHTNTNVQPPTPHAYRDPVSGPNLDRVPW